MKQFNKVDIGVHSKKYRRPLYYEVNSTAPWGVAQPCMVQRLDGKTRITGNFSDLLRLSPLPVPTYANMYKETNMRFVPISQICPFYENMLASQRMFVDGKNLVFNKVPVISNSFLVLLMCAYFCNYNQFYKPVGEDYYVYDNGDNSYDVAMILQGHYGTIVSADSYYQRIIIDFTNNYSTRVTSTVTMDNADFIIRYEDEDKREIYLLCKLNRYGRILRSNLIGCGYSLNIDDDAPLSILPIFAYYKAYYDTYYPQRQTNWQSTTCFNVIDGLMRRYAVGDFTLCIGGDYGIRLLPGVDYNLQELFKQFIEYEFSRTFATSPLDIVSACRDYPENSTESEVSFYDTEGRNIINGAGEPPTLSGQFTSIGLRALSYLTKFISKKSVIGEQLSKTLSTLFGAELSNSTLFDSNRIGYYRLDCKVNPIFSTSDTTTSTGEGEYLGSFAGTGFAQNGNNSYDFTAGEIGYVVALTAIIPDSAYYQGNQYDLHAIDRDTLFNSQYDALGYEVMPYASVVSDMGISFKTLSEGNTQLNSGFGFLPRYSQLKSVKNIVNGDMSRRATADSMSAYYLDKQIVTRQYTMKLLESPTPTYDFKLTEELPPQASSEYQFCCKYPWIGNYNRIFYNSGNLDVGVLGPSDDGIDDNFMFQMSFNYSIYDTKLPVSRSYCTYDEDDDMQTVQQS